MKPVSMVVCARRAVALLVGSLAMMPLFTQTVTVGVLAAAEAFGSSKVSWSLLAWSEGVENTKGRLKDVG